MKTIRIITAFVLFTCFASLGFAGAGPDYWLRMNQAARDKAALAAKTQGNIPTKVQATTQVASCATCGCCAKKA